MQLSRLAFVLFLLAVPTTGTAAEGTSGLRLGLGLGSQQTQPVIVGSVPSGTASFGVSFPPRGLLHATLDFNASGGLDVGMKIPEASRAGTQSLCTVIGALELTRQSSRVGPSLAAGLGVGHSSISNARGPTDSPNFGFVPLKGRTALAFELRAGYAFSGGPGRTRLGMFWLVHGLLLDATSASAHANAFGLGLQY